jgi:L-fuculose-phosphate aldolase
MSSRQQLVHEVVDACRATADHGLVVGGAGNISVSDGSTLAITRSGLRLAAAAESDVCLLHDGQDGELTAEAGSRPSSELELHRACAYPAGPTAIVHTHSAYAVSISTLVDELPAIHYYIEQLGVPVRVAPYSTFGTPELASSTREALGDGDAALLAHHGAVVRARTAAEAVERAVLLEWLCQTYWQAALLGTPRLLGASQLEAVGHQRTLLRARALPERTGI